MFPEPLSVNSPAPEELSALRRRRVAFRRGDANPSEAVFFMM